MTDAPKAQHNRWYRREGHYDLLHPMETQAQYVFILRPDAPDGLTKGYVVGLDREVYVDREAPALEAALVVQEAFSHYLTSWRADIAKLVDYLRTVEEQDYLDRLRYDIEVHRNKELFHRQEADRLQRELDAATEESAR